MALLEVRDLVVSYPVRQSSFCFGRRKVLPAVRGVSFDLHAGEILGLVGESGCGKSSVGRALVQLEKAQSGTIMIDGHPLAYYRKRHHPYQMIFQDPLGSLNPRLKIFTSLDEVLQLNPEFSACDAASRREQAAALLQQVGIDPEALDRYPHQFSGGQRQRIGIARSLAASPKFIVADEPVSALDVSVQAAVVNLLGDLCRRSGTAFLFISHDLAVVEHLCHRVMVMYLGRIVEIAPASELVEHPQHPYTQALLSAVPDVSGRHRNRVVLAGDVPSPLDPPPGCPFHPRCPLAQERCRCECPTLQGQNGHQTACFRAGTPLPAPEA